MPVTEYRRPTSVEEAVSLLAERGDDAILTESALSFLGLGIQPPTPTWGNMLSGAQNFIWNKPDLALYPGLMILLAVLAFNSLGDAVRDALDPFQARR